MVHTLEARVEIAASPEKVRSIFFDFKSYKEFHDVYFMEMIDSEKDPIHIEPGEKLRVTVKTGDTSTFQFRPTIKKNSTDSFQWTASIPVLFSGLHTFDFLPSELHPGGTTLVQGETFSGPITMFWRRGWSMGERSLATFEALNQDLKLRCELLETRNNIGAE